jgi:hypothetical protein
MKFPARQTLSFEGSDAVARAEQLLKEEGADMVEIVTRCPQLAKVRLLRPFVLESEAAQRVRAQRQSNLLCQP